MPPTVPMSSPDLTDAEREAVAAVLRTPNLSMGSEIQAFEAAFSQFTGLKHAIGCTCVFLPPESARMTW
jgi:perosamine synthetase